MATKTLTVKEADALFEAAEYARKNRWGLNSADENENLTSAINKLRHADTLILEQEG